MNGGKKLYDGGTDELFDAYQTRKKITVAFASETAFAPPDGCELLEQSPYKASFMAPKERSGLVVAEIMRKYAPVDISAGEEDIGAVVERIYAAKAGGAA